MNYWHLSRPGSSTQGNNGLVAKKLKKMGNDLDYLNDSGIPMDGVEFESPTTVTRSGIISPNHLASSTNSTTISDPPSQAPSTNQTTTRNALTTVINNEALASDSPALSFGDDSKCSNDFDLTLGSQQQFQSSSTGEASRHIDENLQNQQHDRNPANHQTNSVRSFGDLFDDDDLD